MRNLRNTYSYEERLTFQDTIRSLRVYILAVLKRRQGNTCALCPYSGDKYDIDHMLYNPMMTIDQLRLLCVPCHKQVTDFRPMRNRGEASKRLYKARNAS
jgi:hypothetical protein